MLVHFRLTVPADVADPVRVLLVEHESVSNVTVVPGASLTPAGDLIEADVAREEADELLAQLAALGLDERGGVVLSTPTGTPFEPAREIEQSAPGHPDDAVIWESVEDDAEDGAVPTVTYHLFLVLAVSLAGVAVITDSPVLVVGAMVVGPDFGTVSSVSCGIALRRWGLVLRALRLLVLSFVFAIVVVMLVSMLAYAVGFITPEDVTRPRPNTDFIWHPDKWTVVVALLAGAVGAIALAIDKASALVGVFIAVTTVPAAGNLALALALREPSEIGGSAAQLGINLTGMIVAGTIVLAIMRRTWPWVMRMSDRVFPG